MRICSRSMTQSSLETRWHLCGAELLLPRRSQPIFSSCLLAHKLFCPWPPRRRPLPHVQLCQPRLQKREEAPKRLDKSDHPRRGQQKRLPQQRSVTDQVQQVRPLCRLQGSLIDIIIRSSCRHCGGVTALHASTRSDACLKLSSTEILLAWVSMLHALVQYEFSGLDRDNV